ncbi:MAG: cytochrome c biogenesis protein CcsA [Candidatus Zixiibacteriota bacterium]|nr:MAG: cytochrome c biogenesis protein CcsA [candidate division Zixibacteria bacterium]
MFWKLLLLVWMCGVIVAAFLLPPPQSQLGDVSRIFFFHVPVAWVAVLAFLTAFVYSIRYLRGKDLALDAKAAVASRLGLLFAILATITGSIFAKSSWGSYWNWDPRETSLFILLLIYGAYLVLRSAVEPEERRAALSSVYAILAFVTVPFLVFVVPRVYQSLHPTDSVIDQRFRFQMPPAILATFLASLLGFTSLYVWLFKLETRINTLSGELKEESV